MQLHRLATPLALAAALFAQNSLAQQAATPTPNTTPSAAEAAKAVDANAELLATQPTAAGPLVAVGGISTTVASIVAALVGTAVVVSGQTSTSGTTGTTGTTQ